MTDIPKIDGHPQSRETLLFIYKQVKRNNAITLLGNHEQMLLQFVNSTNMFDAKFNFESWIQNGGESTIKSLLDIDHQNNEFSIDSINKIKKMLIREYPDIISWFNLINPDYRTDDFIFVHAGLNWDVSSPQVNTSIDDKLWIRDDYIWQKERPIKNDFFPHTIFHHNLTDKTIVSGHTPTIFIYGQYENNIKPKMGKVNIPSDITSELPCPVKIIQYPNEKPRIFTDGGCHSNYHKNTGNICYFENGKLTEIL